MQIINNQAIKKRYLNHLAERLIIKWLISLFTFLISCYWLKKNEKTLTFEQFTLSKSCPSVFSKFWNYGNNQISSNPSKGVKWWISQNLYSHPSQRRNKVHCHSIQSRQSLAQSETLGDCVKILIFASWKHPLPKRLILLLL